MSDAMKGSIWTTQRQKTEDEDEEEEETKDTCYNQVS